MGLSRISIYALPFFCILGIAFAIHYFLISGGSPGTSRAGALTDLLVLAEQDFRRPLEAPDVEHESGALGRFERRYGVRVRAEYGAPAKLFEELREGRRGDLYLTGEDAYMHRALAEGVVVEGGQIARLVPVILVRQGNPHGIETVSDLKDPRLRLGVAGAQSGAIGRTTAELFRRRGVSTDQARFTGNSAAEIARAVEQDRVDAAIVWRNVGAQHSRDTQMIDIPENDTVISGVYVAVLAGSDNPRAASQLANFLAGGASHQIFELYGFEVEVDAGKTAENGKP